MDFDHYRGLTCHSLETLKGREMLSIIQGEVSTAVSLILLNGRYGLFCPVFNGMGGAIHAYYSTKYPFKYKGVMICVPPPGYGTEGYVAVQRHHNSWNVLAVDYYANPWSVVEGCGTFEEAKAELEVILGHAPQDEWLSFDEFRDRYGSYKDSEE